MATAEHIKKNDKITTDNMISAFNERADKNSHNHADNNTSILS